MVCCCLFSVSADDQVQTTSFAGGSAPENSVNNESDEIATGRALFQEFQNRNPLDKSFLMKVPFLWTEKDPEGNTYPGKGVVNKPQDRASLQIYDKVIIKPQVESYFEIGDTLDIFVSVRFVEFEGRVANIVKRTGRCCVIEAAPKKLVAVLFEHWDVIRGLERVDKATLFKPMMIDTLLNPGITITGAVFTRVEETPSPYAYQTVIIDRGTKDGVGIGDIFGIYHLSGKPATERLVSIGIIAHVNLSSSSLQLVTLQGSQISSNDKVVLVKRSRISN
jgi:hypothetical protein